MGQYQIISADSHVSPPPTFWRDYLPGSFVDQAPTLESTDEGDFVVFEGRKTPFIMLSNLAGKKAEDYKFKGKISDTRPGGWDPTERVKDQDIDGVDAEAIYGGGPLRTQDHALAIASHRAYNDWLADFCKPSPDRLLGIAYIPVWDVDEAVAEVKHAAKVGLRGALIPGVSPDGADYTDPKFDALWGEIAAQGMSVQVHSSMGGRSTRFDTTPHFLSDMTMTKLSLAEPIGLFIYGGVFERFPTLKLVEVEGGLGWCAFIINYMDHVWNKHRHWTKSDLKEPPSYYFKRHVLGTLIDDPVAIRERHTIGVESIMWSSDYPHSETSWPESKVVIEEHFAGVPDDEKQKMIVGNAAALYHLV